MVDPKKELQEAKIAAEEVLYTIGQAQSELKSGKGWGIFDIIRGGLIASLVKRGRIRDMQTTLETLDHQLERLKKELQDVHLESPVRPSDSFTAKLFDIGFDNVFTDIYVQGELNETGRQLDQLEETVRQIIRELDEALRDWE